MIFATSLGKNGTGNIITSPDNPVIINIQHDQLETNLVSLQRYI